MAWAGRESPRIGIENKFLVDCYALISYLPLDGSLLHDASHMVGSLKAALPRANYLGNRVLKNSAVFETFRTH